MKHGPGWKYVRAVPMALRDVVGKKFWTRYIGSMTRVKAIEVARSHADSDQKIIDGLRALSIDERMNIAGTVVLVQGKTVKGLEAWRMKEAHGPMSLRFLEAAAGSDRPDPLVRWLEAVERTESEQTVASLRDRVGKALLDAALVRGAVAKGHADLAADRVIKHKMSATAFEPALMSLVQLWVRVRAPRNPKSVEKTRLYIRRFAEIAGDLDVTEVTRANIIHFRDALESQGLSAANIGQHLDKLHTLFNVGLSEGVVTVNPVHKVKARRVNGKLADGRQGFTSGHVRAILKALKGESDDFAWTMKLLACHGMRGGEACQLRVDDVTTLYGVPVLRVHDRHGRVKNAASVRDIPIHPMCKGVITFARKVEKAYGSDAWLFQSWDAQKQGRAHKFQNYGNREFLRQKVGISERYYTLHSFRHRFRTLCREAEMPEAISRAIMGHTLGAGEHGNYGSAPSLKKRAEWIARIDPLTG